MGSSLVRPDTLHEQVHDWIRDCIVSGEWDGKQRLPSETLISRQLGVSVGTVRKAMERLARDRVVVRERGRGTFVCARSAPAIGWAFNAVVAPERPASRRISLISATPVPLRECELGLVEGARSASLPAQGIRIERHWHAGDTLICNEFITVAQERFPGLLGKLPAVGVTLHAYYEESFRISVATLTWQISALADEKSAGRSRLRVERRAFDARSALVEICEQILPAEVSAISLCHRA